MFAWRKKNPDPMEAQLREATLRRLAEVVGLPADEFEVRKPAKQAPSKTPQERITELGLSGGY